MFEANNVSEERLSVILVKIFALEKFIKKQFQQETVIQLQILMFQGQLRHYVMMKAFQHIILDKGINILLVVINGQKVKNFYFRQIQ